jgi:hypothetical protein
VSYNESDCGDMQPPIPTFDDGGHLTGSHLGCCRLESIVVDPWRSITRPRRKLVEAIAPRGVSSILIIERENGEAREPMLTHVIASNMGKAYGQMVLGGFESKNAPIVVFRQGIAE